MSSLPHPKIVSDFVAWSIKEKYANDNFDIILQANDSRRNFIRKELRKKEAPPTLDEMLQMAEKMKVPFIIVQMACGQIHYRFYKTIRVREMNYLLLATNKAFNFTIFFYIRNEKCQNQ